MSKPKLQQHEEAIKHIADHLGLDLSHILDVQKMETKPDEEIPAVAPSVAETESPKSESYKLTPVEAKNLEGLLDAGKYDSYYGDKENILKHFDLEKSDVQEIQLLHFDRYISSEDAIVEMKKMGLRPATASELLTFGANHPNVQRNFPIVALGTVHEINRRPHVLALDDGFGVRRASLGWFVGAWGGYWRFAAVKS